MSEFKMLMLKDVAASGRSVISGPFGSNIGKRFFQELGIPVIRGNNLTTDSRKFRDEGFVFLTEKKADELKADAIENDILFTAAGTIGQVGMIPVNATHDRYVISNKQLRLRVDPKKADPNYVYYWLASPWIFKAITNRNTGSTVPLINLGIIKTLPISMPLEVVEQKNIADVLSAIDNKVELNNKINAELEVMAKLIYDYWFVQFDFPDANGKPYKSSGGKMVYSQELKREIPDGWDGCKVGNILSTELGGTPSTKVRDYWGGDIPWLNSGEISNFPIIEADEHITSNAIDDSATSLMPKGTSVLSITRHLRPSILAVDACANQSVVGVYESDALKSSYLYPYLKNEIPRLMTLRTGAQQPHINKGIVDASPIILPPDIILKSYYKKVSTIYKQINNNAFQNKELTELRDWLLPMLMNGQVKVKK